MANMLKGSKMCNKNEFYCYPPDSILFYVKIQYTHRVIHF